MQRDLHILSLCFLLSFDDRRLTFGGSAISKAERIGRIDGLLASFGLTNQADKIVGTPIRTGISGGQKRRLSVASQLITGPKILFLDEPTSGLDSAASREVIVFLKSFAKTYNVSL